MTYNFFHKRSFGSENLWDRKIKFRFMRLIAAVVILSQVALPLHVSFAEDGTLDTTAAIEVVTGASTEVAGSSASEPELGLIGESGEVVSTPLNETTTASEEDGADVLNAQTAMPSAESENSNLITTDSVLADAAVPSIGTSSEELTQVTEATSTDVVGTPSDAHAFVFSTSTPGTCLEDGEVAEAGVEASSTPPETGTEMEDCGGSDFSQHSTSTDEATTSATSENEVASGEMSTGTTPIIMSGKSVALANILNIVNTNSINSSGYILFSNLLSSAAGGIDLRKSSAGSSLEEGCAILECMSTANTIVNFQNDALIDNLIRMSATSGGNIIQGADGAVINTGDAYAGLNLVNFANANFIDSHYALVALNAFGDVHGDIVLPGLKNFFSGGQASAQNEIALTNGAKIENELVVEANSGDNLVLDSGSSTIKTGESHATQNVFNQINTSLIGDASVMILLRVHGGWFGGISSAPAYIVLGDVGDGTYFMSGLFPTGASQLGGLGMTGGGSPVRAVAGTNTATIHNDVILGALSGENSISGADTALITTGNAYAGANVINIANANVIGRNWLLAVINVFGDFHGNIAFGRPDLWMGVQVEAPVGVGNGSEATYKLTVINNGDADATAVRVTDDVDQAHVDILESSLPYTTGADGNLVWELGMIPSGQATEFTYRARFKDAASGYAVTNTVTAMESETDNNLTDNTDTASVVMSPPCCLGYGGVGGGSVWIPPVTETQNSGAGASATLGSNLKLRVARASTSTVATSLSTTTLQMVITNKNGSTIPSVQFIDELRNPEGNIIGREVWNLGQILPNEEVTVSYDIHFGANATSGVYLLSSVVKRPGIADEVFEANGTITLINPIQSPDVSSGAIAGSQALTPSFAESEENKPQEVDPAPRLPAGDNPLVGVAHAWGDDDFAAVGMLSFSNAFLFALLMLLTAILSFLRAMLVSKTKVAPVRRHRSVKIK